MTETSEPSPTPDRFGTVLDMVAEVGCDPSGQDPCDWALEQSAGDDVLLTFPPGEFRFEREHRFDGLVNFGIAGLGRSHREAKFVFPAGYSGIVLGLWNGSDWLLENFTIQQTMDRRTGVGMEIVVDDGLEVRDIEIAGYSPYNRDGGRRGLYCDVLRPDGLGVIERYIHKDPSAVGDYPQGTQAFLADEYHRGTLVCRDWRIENAGENGIYASRGPGDVRVEGGFFSNNDVASIRVSGEGSYVKGATIHIDTETAHSGNVGRYDNTRGIWWESGQLSKSGGVIENCDFVMRSAPESQGLLRVERTAGAVTVRDCRLRNETEWATVDVIAPNQAVDRGPTAFRAEDLEIEARGPGVAPLRINGRRPITLAHVAVSSNGVDRDGIRLASLGEVRLTAGRVGATRYPVRIDAEPAGSQCLAELGAEVALSSVRISGSLLVPRGTVTSGPETARTWCVPNGFEVPHEEVVLTAVSESGLYGHLLDDEGAVVDPDRRSPVDDA